MRCVDPGVDDPDLDPAAGGPAPRPVGIGTDRGHVPLQIGERLDLAVATAAAVIVGRAGRCPLLGVRALLDEAVRHSRAGCTDGVIRRRAGHRVGGIHVGEERGRSGLDQREADGLVDVDHRAAGFSDRREGVRFRAWRVRDDELTGVVLLRFGGGLRSPGTSCCRWQHPSNSNDKTQRTQTSNAHYSIPLVLRPPAGTYPRSA